MSRRYQDRQFIKNSKILLFLAYFENVRISSNDLNLISLDLYHIVIKDLRWAE
jgi:hypothetical protein